MVLSAVVPKNELRTRIMNKYKRDTKYNAHTSKVKN